LTCDFWAENGKRKIKGGLNLNKMSRFYVIAGRDGAAAPGVSATERKTGNGGRGGFHFRAIF
jgi:hypothetical protein